jgi:hypothetical protein
VAQLPPLWAAMASQGLKLDRRTIQSFINRKDARYGVSGQMMLQINISVALAADIGILRFVAERADFISTGLSTFMVSYPTVETVACLRESVEAFDRQMDSAQTLTLEESNKLRNNQKFTLPTSYLAVKQVCRAYHRLLAITLGFNHPITVAYEPFVRHFEDREVELTEYLGRDVRKCARVLRHIQISVHYCLHAVQNNRMTNPPDFMYIFAEIERDSWTPPLIPGVTTRLTPDPGPVAVRARGPVRLCMATKGTPPLNDKGNPMCLRYQVIGYCVADSPRTADHKKHSAADNTKLAAYLAKTKP